MQNRQPIIIKIHTDNRTTFLSIIKKNVDQSENILLEQKIKIDETGFVVTNASADDASIKTTSDRKRLIVKCTSNNNDDVLLHVDIKGHLTLARANTTDLTINNNSDITINHTDFHCDHLNLTANKIINHGILDITKTLGLNVNETIINTPNGKMRVDEKIDINGELINQGLIYGNKDLVLDMHHHDLINIVQKDQEIISSIAARNNLSIQNANKIDNYSMIKVLNKASNLSIQAAQLDNHNLIYSKGDANFETEKLTNARHSSGINIERNLQIKSDVMTNDNVITSDSLKVEAKEIINNQPIKFKKSAELIADQLDNQSQIVAAKNSQSILRLNVKEFENNSQVIAERIEGKVAELTNNQKIYSRKTLDATVGTLKNNKIIHSSDTLSLKIENENSYNFGLIEAKTTNVEIEKNLQNYQFIRSPNGEVNIKSHHDFNNHGQVYGVDCTVATENNLENRGYIIGKNKCETKSDNKIINGNYIISRRATSVIAHDLENAGKILAQGKTNEENRHCELQVNVSHQLKNDAEAIIASKGKLKSVCGNIVNNGNFESREILVVQADHLENNQTIHCGEKSTLTIKQLNNNQTAEIFSGESLVVNTDDAVNFGNIESNELKLQINGKIENKKSIQSERLEINGNEFVNHEAANVDAENIHVNNQLLNNNGTIHAKQDSYYNINKAINNGKITTDVLCDVKVSEQFLQQENSTFSAHKITFQGEGEVLNHSEIHGIETLEFHNKTLTNHQKISAAQVLIDNKIVVNHDKILAEKKVDLQAEHFVNHEKGVIHGAELLNVNINNEILNHGKLSSDHLIKTQSQTFAHTGEMHCNEHIVVETVNNIDHSGVTQAVGKVQMKSASGKLAHKNGKIAANDDVLLDAKIFELDAEIISQTSTVKLINGDVNNRAKINGKKIETDVKAFHNQGKLAADESVLIKCVNNIVNDNVIQSDSIALASNDGIIIQNKEISGKIVSLAAKDIVINESIQTKQQLTLNATQNITNNKLLKSDESLVKLTAGNEIKQNGMLEGKEIECDARTINIKGKTGATQQIKMRSQQDINNNSTVSAPTILINSNSATNDGQYESEKSFVANTTNFINNSVVGSRGTVDITARNQLTVEKNAHILSQGKMTLSADKLLDRSGNIESHDTLTLNVGDIELTRQVQIKKLESVNTHLKRDKIVRIDKPGRIYAQNEIYLNVRRSGTNYTSIIHSGKQIHISGNGSANLKNISENLYESRYTVVGYQKKRQKWKKLWRTKTVEIYGWTNPTPYQTIPVIIASTNIKLGDLNQFQNQGLVEGRQFSFVGMTFHNGRVDNFGGGYVQFPDQHIPLINYFQKPSGDNGLYQYHTPTMNPHYLMTTRFSLQPEVDLRQHLMHKNKRMFKTLTKKRLLGDVFYTADLFIRVFDKLGRPYIERQMVDMLGTKQVLHYINNAVAFNYNHPAIQMGKPLNEKDVNNLHAPILWPIKALVEGKEKIVSFDIYMPSKTQAALKLHDDGHVNIDKAEIIAEGNVKNTAYITIAEDLTIICEDFINTPRILHEKAKVVEERGFWRSQKVREVDVKKVAPGGLTEAGSLFVKAKRDVTNRGVLLTRQDLHLIAGNNIVNEALPHQEVVTWNVGNIGKIIGHKKNWDIATHFVPATMESTQGKVTLFAGNEIKTIASLIEAEKDILLQAKKLIKEDVASSTHVKKTSIKLRGLSIKKDKEHEIIIERAVVCSKTGNVTFIAYEGDIENRGSTMLAALKIVLDAKGGTVSIHPFVIATETYAHETGLKGLRFSSTTKKQDKTRVATPVVASQQIEIRSALDVNIKSTILHAIETLSIEAGRDINVSYETIQHYIKSEGFHAALQFFGASAINHMMVNDFEKAAVSLLHEFPLLASYDNLLHSKDTADVSGNGIHAIYQTYKHLKAMAETSKDLSDILKQQVTFDPKLHVGFQASEKYWTEILVTWLSAQRIILKAGRDVNLSAVKMRADDAKVTAGRDIKVDDGIEERQSDAHGFGATLTANGIPVGVDANAQDASGIHHVFADLKIKNKIEFVAGRTLQFSNVELEAAKIYLEAADLDVETILDQDEAESNSFAVGVDAISVKHASLKSSLAKKQTTLRALDEFVAHIGNTTNIKGAVIDALRGELRTQHLNKTDVHGEQKSKSISIGVTDLGGFSQGQFFVADVDVNQQKTQQNNRATVSSNIQIITQSDITNLNRDLARAQELSKEGKHVRVVLPLSKDLKNKQENEQENQQEIKQENKQTVSKPKVTKQIPAKNVLKPTMIERKSNDKTNGIKTNNNKTGVAQVKQVKATQTPKLNANKTQSKNPPQREKSTQSKTSLRDAMENKLSFWDKEKKVATIFEKDKDFIGIKFYTASGIAYSKEIGLIKGGKVAFNFVAGTTLASGERTFTGSIGKIKLSGSLDGPTAKIEASATMKGKPMDLKLVIDSLVELAGINGSVSGELCLQNHCVSFDLDGHVGFFGKAYTYTRGASLDTVNPKGDVVYRDNKNLGKMFVRYGVKFDYFKKEEKHETDQLVQPQFPIPDRRKQ